MNSLTSEVELLLWQMAMDMFSLVSFVTKLVSVILSGEAGVT